MCAVNPHDQLADPRERHRPHDPLMLMREVQRLNSEGLTPSDIVHALKLDEAFVREVLGEGRQ